MAVALPIPLVEAFGWTYMSCMVYNLSVMLFPPLFITPVLVSQIQHYRGARIHAKMAMHAQSRSVKTKRDKSLFEQLVTDLKSERQHLRRNVVIMYVAVLAVYVVTITIFVKTEKKITAEAFFDSVYSEYGEECEPMEEIFFVNCLYAVVSCMAIAWFVRNSKTEGLQDDYGVNKEYKGVVIVTFLFMPVYFCLMYFPEPELVFNAFDPSLVFITTMIIIFGLLVLWPACRTFRRRNKDFALSRLSVEHTDLVEVLNSNLYFLFIEHLKTEFSVENCLFWKEVQQLKIDYGPGGQNSDTFGNAGRLGHSKSEVFRSSGGSSSNSVTSSNHQFVGDSFPCDVCKDIVDTFIADGAPMEINISSKVKQKILADLHYDEYNVERSTSDGIQLGGTMETVPANIFEEAQSMVFRLMETDSLPRFKAGKLFKQYLEAMAEEGPSTSQRSATGVPHRGSRGSARSSGAGGEPNVAPILSKHLTGSGRGGDTDNHGIELAKVMGKNSKQNQPSRSTGGRGGHHSPNTSTRSAGSNTSVKTNMGSNELVKNII
jgi:hypothetical protein